MGGKVRRTPTVDRATMTALAAVKDAETRLIALEYACRGERQRSGFFGDAAPEYSALHGVLYKRLNDAWRNLMMWTTVNPQNKKVRNEVARLVWERYLRDGMEIMNYLDISNVPPSMYDGADAEMFRSELNYLADCLGIERPPRGHER